MKCTKRTKIIMLVIGGVVACSLLFMIFFHKNEVDGQIVNYGNYSQDDIHEIINLTIGEMEMKKGITLIDIKYDGNQSKELEDSMKDKYDSSEVIVVSMNFKTGWDVHESMNANSEYEKYNYIYIQNIQVEKGIMRILDIFKEQSLLCSL